MTIVAIDGPAAAGKSTVARLAAERLGYRYVDTGALYRALAAAALQRGIDARDGEALAGLAGSLELRAEGGRVWIDGTEVTDRLRSDAVNRTVSAVSALPQVRAALVELQRRLAAPGRVVIEGRDIGSTIAPQAGVKIFLTASLHERARRRGRELGIAGDERSLITMAAALEERDARDSSRADSPLRRAPGAMEIDTTSKSLDEVVDEVVRLVRSAAGSP